MLASRRKVKIDMGTRLSILEMLREDLSWSKRSTQFIKMLYAFTIAGNSNAVGCIVSVTIYLEILDNPCMNWIECWEGAITGAVGVRSRSLK